MEYCQDAAKLYMALAGMKFYLEAGRVAAAMAGAGLKIADSRSIETPMGPCCLISAGSLEIRHNCREMA